MLNLLTGALLIVFGHAESSDFWVDCLKLWWSHVRAGFHHVKRLVIYLDNGPHNNGSRTQFLKRMIEFADWCGLDVLLVYYPPYHSKYNPIEGCWSALEKKWGGSLLNCLEVVLRFALRMTWNGQHPTVQYLHGDYPAGVKVVGQEWKSLQPRLQRSSTLPKYHILIKPLTSKSSVS